MDSNLGLCKEKNNVLIFLGDSQNNQKAQTARPQLSQELRRQNWAWEDTIAHRHCSLPLQRYKY